MAGSVNKVIIKNQAPSEMYLAGASIPQVSDATGIALSTLRFRFKREGILRDRKEAIRMAAAEGRMGAGRGRRREFTEAHCAAISAGKMKWAEENAVGVSFKKSGYVEYTRGENKGRSVHVVRMEARIGRPLLPDECVHHIDGNKHNNDDNNLALVTYAAHMRLHQRERRIAKGKV